MALSQGLNFYDIGCNNGPILGHDGFSLIYFLSDWDDIHTQKA